MDRLERDDGVKSTVTSTPRAPCSTPRAPWLVASDGSTERGADLDDACSGCHGEPGRCGSVRLCHVISPAQDSALADGLRRVRRGRHAHSRSDRRSVRSWSPVSMNSVIMHVLSTKMRTVSTQLFHVVLGLDILVHLRRLTGAIACTAGTTHRNDAYRGAGQDDPSTPAVGRTNRHRPRYGCLWEHDGVIAARVPAPGIDSGNSRA